MDFKIVASDETDKKKLKQYPYMVLFKTDLGEHSVGVNDNARVRDLLDRFQEAWMKERMNNDRAKQKLSQKVSSVSGAIK